MWPTLFPPCIYTGNKQCGHTLYNILILTTLFSPYSVCGITHQTFSFIGASLNEPHIDVVVLLRCTVCNMYVCMYVKTVGVRTV